MHVNKTPSEIARIDAIQRSQSATTASSAAPGTSPQAPESAAVRRSDQVQISDAGRALSGTGASDSGSQVTSLDPSRIDALRAKILGGAYDSLQMVDQVARAVIRSGDL